MLFFPSGQTLTNHQLLFFNIHLQFHFETPTNYNLNFNPNKLLCFHNITKYKRKTLSLLSIGHSSNIVWLKSFCATLLPSKSWIQVVENNHGALPDNQITTGLQPSAFSAGLQLLSCEKNCCDDKHCLKTPVWWKRTIRWYLDLVLPDILSFLMFLRHQLQTRWFSDGHLVILK